jgi:hypothetical protein
LGLQFIRIQKKMGKRNTKRSSWVGILRGIPPLPNGDQCTQKSEWKAMLLQILEDDELYWFEKSHENWLLNGDKTLNIFIVLQMVKKESNLYWP